MARKHTAALVIVLVVSIAGIFLSLIRSKSAQNPVGEIKHFTEKNRQIGKEKISGTGQFTTMSSTPKLPKQAPASTKAPLVSSDRNASDTVLQRADASSAPSRAPLREAGSSRMAAHTEKDALPPKALSRLSPERNETKPAGVRSGAGYVSNRSLSGNQPIDEPSLEEGVMIIHRVAPGESLLGLAKKYRTTAYQIAKRNMISENARLIVGQELEIIPGEEATYCVQKGESLRGIARRFGADFHDIAALNDLDDNATLHPNQTLVMPISQKRIDTILEEIAEKRRQEELERKLQYQQKFLTRLKLQQDARAKLAKLRAEKAARARKLAKLKRDKEARLRKAKQKFKYTSSSKYQHKLRVVATAYTSHRSQTDRTPFLAAWNNRIRPGMKIIAVSPDLIRKYGLTNGVRVKIGGLPGTYVIRDKMNKRLHNHIDIYMGTNRRRALRWGRRRVVMYW